KGFRVLAVNEETWTFEKRVVTNAFSTGRKPVFRLRTRLGREICATPNHKFRAVDRWRRLDDLVAGMPIAVPRPVPASADGRALEPVRTSARAAGTPAAATSRHGSAPGRVVDVAAARAWHGRPSSDVSWDEIASIEPAGDARVYDLTVDSLHNFVAEG